MIKAINEKYYQNNLVQLMPNTKNTHLIISDNEIILLKIDNKIYINKYQNNPNRNLFPLSENDQIDEYHFTEIFECNKPYLNFLGEGGYNLSLDYFYKGNNRAIFTEISIEDAKLDAIDTEKTYTKEELEDKFNKNNYDMLFLLSINGTINYAYSKKDNFNIGSSIIPTDVTIENNEEEIEVIGPSLFRNFSHILVINKDGKFNLSWIKVKLTKDGKYTLITSPIEFKELTVDDIMEYNENYGIEYTEDLCEPKTINNEQKEKSGVKRILTKIFK